MSELQWSGHVFALFARFPAAAAGCTHADTRVHCTTMRCSQMCLFTTTTMLKTEPNGFKLRAHGQGRAKMVRSGSVKCSTWHPGQSQYSRGRGQRGPGLHTSQPAPGRRPGFQYHDIGLALKCCVSREKCLLESLTCDVTFMDVGTNQTQSTKDRVKIRKNSITGTFNTCIATPHGGHTESGPHAPHRAQSLPGVSRPHPR